MRALSHPRRTQTRSSFFAPWEDRPIYPLWVVKKLLFVYTCKYLTLEENRCAFTTPTLVFIFKQLNSRDSFGFRVAKEWGQKRLLSQRLGLILTLYHKVLDIVVSLNQYICCLRANLCFEVWLIFLQSHISEHTHRCCCKVKEPLFAFAILKSWSPVPESGVVSSHRSEICLQPWDPRGMASFLIQCEI